MLPILSFQSSLSSRLNILFCFHFLLLVPKTAWVQLILNFLILKHPCPSRHVARMCYVSGSDAPGSLSWNVKFHLCSAASLELQRCCANSSALLHDFCCRQRRCARKVTWVRCLACSKSRVSTTSTSALYLLLPWSQ